MTAAGSFQQETTYQLKELADDGVAKISMESKFTPTGAPATTGTVSSGTLKVTEHKQTGAIRFAAQAGRVTEAEQTQKLVTERPYRETTITVTLTSKQKTTVQSNRQP